MAINQQEERIAALLTALGPKVSKSVIGTLPADAAERVTSLLERFQEQPLEDRELEDVLDEFMRFFRFAAQRDGFGPNGVFPETEPHKKHRPAPVARPVEEAPAAKPFVPTGDAFLDLQQLEPFQVAGALAGESPRTIALVLDCLSSTQAGATLGNLPEDVRSTVFMMLRDPVKAPAVMLERIVRTTVEKGCRLDASAVADPADEANRKMADLLRAMKQAERAKMFESLEKQDKEMADQIRKLLYTFEDILTVSDRSVQKILGDIDMASLALALKDADQRIVDKIMGNLSKRAGTTLTEEIEFLGHVKPAEQEQGRQVICDVIARLDASGDLERE